MYIAVGDDASLHACMQRLYVLVPQENAVAETPCLVLSTTVRFVQLYYDTMIAFALKIDGF